MFIPGKVAVEGVEPKTAVAEYPGVFQRNALAQMNIKGTQIRSSLECFGNRCYIVGWMGEKILGLIINSTVVEPFFI